MHTHSTSPTLHCELCGEAFTVPPSLVGVRRFCSQACASIGNRNPDRLPIPNPSGLCMCGCGQPTPIAKKTQRERGTIIGYPIRYINGHNRRLSPLEYVEEDRGYTTPCWIWQRQITNAGYGRYAGRALAHRVIYEREVGPIPEGMELDHLCRVPACVNPAHLEPVTHRVNVLRGMAPAAIKYRTNRCGKGHEFTPENTYLHPNGTRRCRECNRIRNKQRWQEKKRRRDG